MTIRNIILTGGINHDYEDTAAALAEVLLASGITSVIYTDIDEGFDALDEGHYDLVTLFALRWRMLDDDKYIPFRDEWQYEINERDQQNLKRHLAAGRGMLGLHTSAICFDTWPEWPSLLGVKWVWGTTFHPPPESIQIDVLSTHPAIDGLSDFTVVDEIYHNLSADPDATPLLSTISSTDGSTQPLAWAHKYQSGRVIFDAMGHDRASITTTGHARFLQKAAHWCIGR